MTHHSTLATDGLDGGPTQTGLKVWTGAEAVLSAAHRSRDGNLHGHTWTIRAWWPGVPDAMERQAALRSYLSFFDHTALPDSVAWGEHLGQRILEDLGCAKVEVSRPAEGLYAMIDRGLEE